MGGAVAARLASDRELGGLILESAFTSLEAMAGIHYAFLPPFLYRSIRGHWATLDHVRTSRSPLLVIHGTMDEIVPFSMGGELFDAGPEPKEWIPVEGAGHNDVYWVGGEEYFKGVADFARRCAEGRPLV